MCRVTFVHSDFHLSSVFGIFFDLLLLNFAVMQHDSKNSPIPSPSQLLTLNCFFRPFKGQKKNPGDHSNMKFTTDSWSPMNFLPLGDFWSIFMPYQKNPSFKELEQTVEM